MAAGSTCWTWPRTNSEPKASNTGFAQHSCSPTPCVAFIPRFRSVSQLASHPIPGLWRHQAPPKALRPPGVSRKRWLHRRQHRPAARRVPPVSAVEVRRFAVMMASLRAATVRGRATAAFDRIWQITPARLGVYNHVHTWASLY